MISRGGMMRIMLMIIIVMLLIGCAPREAEELIKDTQSEKGVPMTVEEAGAIVLSSDCVKEGSIKGEPFYNNITYTWWFDLDIDKPGCSPACVVEDDKTADINWRCTGLIVDGPQNPEERHDCKEKERAQDVCIELYQPVCGWYTEDIKCFAYPCAETFSNGCFACNDMKVAYWTQGECPQTGSSQG
ncbi:hypothetical protein J4460_03220 [Candidatus Woesearchaeota archaeon]|nr:MAG: hypothetical protein QS99_C0008G0014 [archaeon GW2011_AR4]MBS3129658.1 hypothetical protein [Candidatus Woesearchaeota archaeon]HIH38762.1 hypothetical protein [Candidatus Woesearchaeota archaeon]HIH49178.1 hypothetical protein [Candidatus Woesearchaeota archaeon]HIJ03320.1 hypothetical protein [Candidatus Woesearchaeota archaeon]